MNDLPENELFSAYLDGELTADEQAEVEQLLAASPAARQLVDELRALRGTLQELPTYQIGKDISPEVLRRAEEQIRAEAARPQVRAREAVRGRKPRWRAVFGRVLRPRNLVWSGLAASVALLLWAIEAQRPGPLQDRTIAMDDGAASVRAPAAGEAVERVPSSRGRGTVAGEMLAGKAAEGESPRAGYRSASGTEAGGTGAAGAAATPAPAVPPAGMPQPAFVAKGAPAADKPAALPPVSKNGEWDYAKGQAGLGGYAGGARGGGQLASDSGQPAAPSAGGRYAREGGLADSAKKAKLLEAPAASQSLAPGIGGQPGYAYGNRQLEPALLVRCNVTAEAVQGQVVKKLLEKQQIALAGPGEDARVRAIAGKANLLARKFAAYHVMVKAANEIQVDVQATPDQVVALVADLQSRPKEFSSVSLVSTGGDQWADALKSIGGARFLESETAAQLHYHLGASLPGPADVAAGKEVGRVDLDDVPDQRQRPGAALKIQGKAEVEGLPSEAAAQSSPEHAGTTPALQRGQAGTGLLGGAVEQENRPARTDLDGQPKEPLARPEVNGSAGRSADAPPPSKGPRTPAEVPAEKRKEETEEEEQHAKESARAEQTDDEEDEARRRAGQKWRVAEDRKQDLEAEPLELERPPEEASDEEAQQPRRPSPAQPPGQVPPTVYVRLVFQIVGANGADVAASIAEEAAGAKTAVQAAAEPSQAPQPPAVERDQR